MERGAGAAHDPMRVATGAPASARPQPAAAALTDAEIAELRFDTPAADHHVHLNHASASLLPGVVIRAIDGFQNAERRSGVQAASQACAADLQNVRGSVARLIGADPGSIVFFDTTTRAWAYALGALVAGGARRLVTVRTEWGPNILNAFLWRDRVGLEVEVVPSAPDGRLDFARLAEAVAPGDLVAVPLVSTASGIVNPVGDLAAEIHRRDALVLVDAAQAVGQVPVQVTELGADVLVFPSRKWLRGPKGAAVLSVSEPAIARMGPPATIDLASADWDEDADVAVRAGLARFASWEHDPAVRLGLAAAADLTTSLGPTRIAARIRGLVERAIHGAAASGLPLPFEAPHANRSGILTWSDPRRDVAAVARTLQSAGVFVAVVGPATAPLALAERGAPAALRASIHYLNTNQEIDLFIARLAAAWKS